MSFKSSLSNLYVNSEPIRIESTSGNRIVPIFNESGNLIQSGISINDIASIEDINTALDSNIQTVTVSQLQNLINIGGIKITKKYLVSNPQDGGQIVVDGNSSSGVNPIATWYYTSNHKAFGLFRLSAGSTGAVTVLTVNGTSIISSSISYNTSLTQTVTNIVANINGYSSTSGYRAYAVNDVCVIEYQTATTSINSATVAVTTTGTLTAANISNMRKGMNPTLYRFSILYSASNDRILQCQDDNVNLMKCSMININSYGYNPITRFRWNDPSYKRNTFDDCNFLPCFVEDSSFGFSANYFDKDSQCQYNIALNTSYVYGNKIGAGGTFIYNYSLATANISYNVCVNQTYNASNPKYGINYNSILSTNLSSGILSNTLLAYGSYIDNNYLATGTARIQFNTLSAGGTSIYNNQLTSNATSIQYNNLNSYGANINANTLSNTNCYIRYNTLNSYTTSISNNIISGGSSEIQYNTLLAANSSISTNTISGGSSFIRYNSLQGGNSNINSNIMNQSATIIENNIFSAPSATITAWTPTSTAKTYSNITWTPTEYSFTYTSLALNNTANRGQANSPIYIGIVPNKWYNTNVEWDGTGLTGSSSGAAIKGGLETDNNASGFPNTAITSLTSPIAPTGLTRTKSTVTNRSYIITPNVGITAGTFKIYVTGKIGI